MKYLYALLFTTLFWSCNNPPEIEADSAITLVAYPNPAGKRISFHVENDALSEFTFQILDPKGKAIFDRNVPAGDVTHSFELDPTDYGTGAFHAVLHINGSVYTKKFMVL